MGHAHAPRLAPLSATSASIRDAAGSARAWPIAVRLARPDDRDAVLGFASRTWDDWDYIPLAWPDWIAATDGVLLVATPGPTFDGRPPLDADGRALTVGRPIAVARVAILAEGEAWFEGIRVDPRVRGMGVGTDVQVAELRWAAAHEARVVRYDTAARNEASHRLGARHGFETRSVWRAYGRVDDDEELRDHEAAAIAHREGRDRRATLVRRMVAERLAPPPDSPAGVVGRWWDRLSRDPTFVAGGGLYEYRPWAMQRLTGERFAAHVAAGEVACTVAADGWALAILTERGITAEDLGLHVSPVAGDPGVAITLLGRVEGLAGERARLRLPDPDPPLVTGVEARFEAAGFSPHDRALHLLERALDDAHPLPGPDDPALLDLADEPRRLAVPRSVGP